MVAPYPHPYLQPFIPNHPLPPSYVSTPGFLVSAGRDGLVCEAGMKSEDKLKQSTATSTSTFKSTTHFTPPANSILSLHPWLRRVSVLCYPGRELRRLVCEAGGSSALVWRHTKKVHPPHIYIPIYIHVHNTTHLASISPLIFKESITIFLPVA